jgi:hypothetical protein
VPIGHGTSQRHCADWGRIMDEDSRLRGLLLEPTISQRSRQYQVDVAPQEFPHLILQGNEVPQPRAQFVIGRELDKKTVRPS